MTNAHTGLMEALTVGQVAETFGVTVRTLHHYDEVGLLHPSERTPAGYRLYTGEDLQRLSTIVVYRRLDFSLEEIGELLDADGAEVIDHLRQTGYVILDLPPLSVDPAADPQALVDWVAPLWADSGKAPPARLVEGPQALADVKQPFVSILSLSSLAALEQRLGRNLGTDRWRGNLWIDGWEPYAERDMQLHRIRIGDTVVLKLTERIGRCAATSADTETGCLDGDTPAELERHFGHQDFGVYAEVRTPGTIRPGDAVVVL